MKNAVGKSWQLPIQGDGKRYSYTLASGASVLFSGAVTSDNRRVKIPLVSGGSPTPANIGATDFTIEMRLKTIAGNNAAAIATGSGYNWITGNIFYDRDRFSQNPGFGISLGAGRVVFGVKNLAGQEQTWSGTTDIRDGNWHTVAVTRNVTTGAVQIFVDGVREVNAASGPTGSLQYAPGSVPISPSWEFSDPFLVLGAEKHDVAPATYPPFYGYMDEFRQSTSIRYSANYTPASSPFTDDANTATLMHFDGTGSTIVDSATPPTNGTLQPGATREADTPFASAGITLESGWTLVSGTVADGETITIRRSAGGLGTKPNGALPRMFVPYTSNSSAHPTLSRTTQSIGGTWTNSVVPSGYAGAGRISYPRSGGGGAGDMTYPAGSRVYIWIKKRYNWNFVPGNAFNLKMYRFWGAGYTVPTTIIGGHQGSSGSSGDPRITPEGALSGVDRPLDGYTSYRGHAFEGNVWMNEEVEFLDSGAGQDNGTIRWIRNAVDYPTDDPDHGSPRIGESLTNTWRTRQSGVGTTNALVNFDQNSDANGGAYADPVYQYIACVYADDSWCRVIVSDEPTYRTFEERTSTAVYGITQYEREPQIPTAWSDTDITVVLRKGGHASLSGKHLYVINNNRQAFKVGTFT